MDLPDFFKAKSFIMFLTAAAFSMPAEAQMRTWQFPDANDPHAPTRDVMDFYKAKEQQEMERRVEDIEYQQQELLHRQSQAPMIQESQEYKHLKPESRIIENHHQIEKQRETDKIIADQNNATALEIAKQNARNAILIQSMSPLGPNEVRYIPEDIAKELGISPIQKGILVKDKQ